MNSNEGKEITFPIMTRYKGDPVTVVGDFESIPENELMNNVMYVYKGNIWRYTAKPENAARKFPIIFFNKDGSIGTMKSIFNETISLDSAINDRLNIICQSTDENATFNDDIEESIPVSSDAAFVPQIKEEDDFLKKMIKTLLHIKKVTSSRYKSKLQHEYSFSNLTQGLKTKTKISTTIWQTWIELLGIDCIVILKDSGADKEDPINQYVVYKSRNDTVSLVEKDKISDFLSEAL